MNNNYEVIEDRRIDDLNSQGTILKHKKTGARVVLLSNDDENKVFYIGFRTPPYDSTGLPHILEHSVLCGSKKFPAKDPFIELAKGSLNTFLNAMTYPDKTVYPVASCNDKDFQNLMEVYLDAVFYPNIYKKEEIFRQEGWRYELENSDDDLTINGVVYNEMKGAFSNPDDVLAREVMNSLFPDTAYGFESGGDPDVIPELSYEDFLAFHQKYYHPSNSYIYLYGNMDMEEKLAYLNDEYLSKFDAIEIDSSIKKQPAFDKPVEKTVKYSVTQDEPIENNAYVAYTTICDTSLNKELYVAFQVLEYALILAPGAPVTERLIKSNLVNDVDSSYDNGVLQPYFSIIGKGANEEDKDKIVDLIKEELQNAVKNGIDKKTLLAGINVYEFRYREADFGRYPKGLMYGLQAFDSWLYDDKAPFMHIEANDTFAFLRNKVDTDYFEKLIESYLLNNNHSSVVVLAPERGLTAIKDKALADKLAKYKDSLSEDEIVNFVDRTVSLKTYQEEPSTEEELNTIPLLSISDLKKEAKQFKYDVKDVDGVESVFADLFTNGIGYLKIYNNITDIPRDLLPYVGLLTNLHGYVNTKNYSYADLASEVNINTGGISSTSSISTDKEDADKFEIMFMFSARVLYGKLDKAFELIKEHAIYSDFSDDERIKELLLMIKTRMQSSFVSAGHSTAFKRAMSYLFESDACMELMSGLDFYKFVDDLIENYDERKAELKEKLAVLSRYIFRKDNLLLSYTGEAKSFETVEKGFIVYKDDLYTEKVALQESKINITKKNEGFKTGAKVQYVAVAGNYKKAGLPYTGALRVMKVIMGYDYLWNNVRVLGGAYGCMSGFVESGKSYFVSYRDPNLTKTLDVYEGAVSYLESFDANERDMTKYIIGAIAEMDTPLTPSQEGSTCVGLHLSRKTNADIQKERDEVIECSVDDIKKLSKYVSEMLSDECLCVVGAEEKIEENKDLFNTVEDLI